MYQITNRKQQTQLISKCALIATFNPNPPPTLPSSSRIPRNIAVFKRNGRLVWLRRKLRSASISISSVCKKRSAFVRKLSSQFQYLPFTRVPSVATIAVAPPIPPTPPPPAAAGPSASSSLVCRPSSAIISLCISTVPAKNTRCAASFCLPSRPLTAAPGARYRDDTTISGISESLAKGELPHQQQHQHERRRRRRRSDGGAGGCRPYEGLWLATSSVAWAPVNACPSLRATTNNARATRCHRDVFGLAANDATAFDGGRTTAPAESMRLKP